MYRAVIKTRCESDKEEMTKEMGRVEGKYD